MKKIFILIIAIFLICGCAKEQDVKHKDTDNEVIADDDTYLVTDNNKLEDTVEQLYIEDEEIEVLSEMTNAESEISNDEEDDDVKRQPMFLGLCATYKDVERPEYYSIEYFRSIDGNYTYYDVVNDIGEPNGTYGSGIVREYWKVEDKFIIMHYSFEGIVLKVELCNQNEVEEVLFRNEEYEKQHSSN